jgi:hypothetical protein
MMTMTFFWFSAVLGLRGSCFVRKGSCFFLGKRKGERTQPREEMSDAKKIKVRLLSVTVTSNKLQEGEAIVFVSFALSGAKKESGRRVAAKLTSWSAVRDGEHDEHEFVRLITRISEFVC